MGNRVAKKVFSSSGVLLSTTYYILDGDGNVVSVYSKTLETNLTLSEIHLYGSARLGMQNENKDMTSDDDFNDDGFHFFVRGAKSFELSNHLGNVLLVITNQKLAVQCSTNNAYYHSEVVSYTDYYPFGLPMDHGQSGSDRQWNGYRFSFNGKESDIEFGNKGIKQDYGFRIYNQALGKFLSVDPLFKDYPWYSAYQFAGNCVIMCSDVDGLEPDPKIMLLRITTPILLPPRPALRPSVLRANPSQSPSPAPSTVIADAYWERLQNPNSPDKRWVRYANDNKTIIQTGTDYNCDGIPELVTSRWFDPLLFGQFRSLLI